MKRLLVTALWMFAAWYLTSGIAIIFGLPDLLGPAVGSAAGLLVAVDPGKAIWSRAIPQRA